MPLYIQILNTERVLMVVTGAELKQMTKHKKQLMKVLLILEWIAQESECFRCIWYSEM